jgi:spore coat-associated protein N
MSLKRKASMALAAVAIGTSLAGAGTMALFTSSASNAANAFIAGTLRITTSSTPVFSTTDLTFGNMAPGDHGDRTVSVTNTGSLDAWVHIKSFTTSGVIFNGGGLALSDTTGAVLIPSGESRDFTIHFDLPISAGNGFQNKNGTASINFEAIQTRNNTLPQDWNNKSTTSPSNELITDQNLTVWTKYFADTFSASSYNNGISNIIVNPVNGWEQLYHAYTVTPGKTYTLSITYDSNDYSPYTGPIPVQVLYSTPTPGNNNQYQTTARVFLLPNQTNKTTSISFTPTNPTIYLNFNYGWAEDSRQINTMIKNISLIEN